MSESDYNFTSNLSLEKCRVCLKTSSTRAMTADEMKWYRNVLQQKCSCSWCSTAAVCAWCSVCVRRSVLLQQQCVVAHEVLQEAAGGEIPKAVLKKSLVNNLVNSGPKTYYLGPEIDLDDTINTENIYNYIEESKDEILTSNYEEISINYDNGYSDTDDVPLVMLGKESPNSGKVKKKRKSSKSSSESKCSTKTKSEESSVIKQSSRSKKKRPSSELRPGFSSRMVQETDEYIVIKLTEEQVLSELSDRRSTSTFTTALYKCTPCAVTYNFQDVLDQHMLKHLPERGSFQCSLCTQYCPSAVSLRGHMKSHTTRYECKICGCVRRSRQHLLEHAARLHRDAPPTYRCSTCDFHTDKRTVMQRHVRSHRPPAPRSALCHICQRVCRSKDSLRVHLARHSSRCECGVCGRRFPLPALLQRHHRAAHTHTDCYCVECDLRFKSPDNLRLHFKKAKRHRDTSSNSSNLPHPTPPAHRCGECGRLYSSADSLRAHTRRVHRGTGLYQCTVCRKGFARKNLLSLHLRSHPSDACASSDTIVPELPPPLQASTDV